MSELNSFESSLLEDLKRRTAHTSRRPRGAVLAGSVLTVGAAACIAVLGTVLVPAPAYAVDEAPTGDIVITLNSLRDAAGLEAELARYGIEADVSYDADTHAEVEVLDTSAEPAPSDPKGTNSDVCGWLEAVAVIEVSRDRAIITIPAGAIPDAQDLRIATLGDDGFAGLSVSWTDGDGNDCSYGSVTFAD